MRMDGPGAQVAHWCEWMAYSMHFEVYPLDTPKMRSIVRHSLLRLDDSLQEAVEIEVEQEVEQETTETNRKEFYAHG